MNLEIVLDEHEQLSFNLMSLMIIICCGNSKFWNKLDIELDLCGWFESHAVMNSTTPVQLWLSYVYRFIIIHNFRKFISFIFRWSAYVSFQILQGRSLFFSMNINFHFENFRKIEMFIICSIQYKCIRLIGFGNQWKQAKTFKTFVSKKISSDKRWWKLLGNGISLIRNKHWLE